MVVRLDEAQYENGVLRSAERLGLRPGECVKLIVMRRPDPSRGDLAKLAKTGNGDDLPLAEQGLAEWASTRGNGAELKRGEVWWADIGSYRNVGLAVW